MTSGRGNLTADGIVLGSVEFQIRCDPDEATNAARGHVWATADVLSIASKATRLTLLSEDSGLEITLTVVALPSPGVAEITITGSPDPL